MFCLRKGSTAWLTDTPVQLVIDKTFRFGSGQVEKISKGQLKSDWGAGEDYGRQSVSREEHKAAERIIGEFVSSTEGRLDAQRVVVELPAARRRGG